MTDEAQAPLSAELIVEVASGIVRERGVSGLTMRHLSDELGVSLGATYRHVPTKRRLLLMLAETIYADVLTREVSGEPLEQAQAMVVAIYDGFASYPGLAAYIGLHADEFESPAVVARITQTLVDAGATQGDAERLLLIFVLLMNGALTVVLGDELDPMKRAVFVHGVEVLTRGEVKRASQQR